MSIPSKDEFIALIQQKDLKFLDQSLLELSRKLTSLEELSRLCSIPDKYTNLIYLVDLESNFPEAEHKGFVSLWFFAQLKRLNCPFLESCDELRLGETAFTVFPKAFIEYFSQITVNKKKKTIAFPIRLNYSKSYAMKILDAELKALHQAAQRDPKLLGFISVLRREKKEIQRLPKSILQMSYLTELHLSNNRLNATLPAWVQQIKDKLPPSALDKYAPYPSGMDKLHNLRILDLSKNGITSIPSWILKLKGLHSLDLSGNQLTILPDRLDSMESLKILAINDNPLSELPDSLWRCTNLTELRFTSPSNFRFPDSASQLFHHFTIEDGEVCFQFQIKSHNSTWESKNTRILELKIQAILERCETDPTLLSQIRKLDCSSYSLEKDIPEQLSQLIHLEELNLSKNRLTSLPEWFSQLKQVKNLDLSENQFKETPEVLKNFSDIRINFRLNRDLERLDLNVSGLLLTRKQWYRLHPRLLNMTRLQYCEFEDSTETAWTEERKNTLSEHFKRRDSFQRAFQRYGDQMRGTLSNDGATYYHPNLDATKMRRCLKDLWRQHADRSFFNEEVLGIHWIGWLRRNSSGEEEFKEYIKRNPIHECSNDELSVHGYTSAEGLKALNRYSIGIIIKKKQVTFASKIDAFTEELSKKHIGKAIRSSDGTVPQFEVGSKIRQELLKKIKEGIDPEGHQLEDLQEFYQSSGYPKRPNLSWRMDRDSILSSIDLPANGNIYEMIVDNWFWDSVVVNRIDPPSFLKELVPDVQIFTLEEMMQGYFPTTDSQKS